MGDKILDSVRDKQNEELVWSVSLNFLEGNQRLEFNKFSRTLNNAAKSAKRPISKRKVKRTHNLLLTIYRHIVSKLAVEYPSMSVLPASPNTDDIIKAKTSEEALKYYWSNEKMKYKLHDAIKWLVSCGNVGLHSFYDPDDKKVHTEIVSPYDLFFEKSVRDQDESEWCAVRSYVRRKELKEIYPEHAKTIDKANLTPEQDIDNLQDIPSNRVEIYDVYFKDGRQGVLLDNTWLWEGEVPKGSRPVEHIRYTDVPNRLWGISLLANVIDLQHTYNIRRNQISDNAELMGNPPWIVPKTSDVAHGSMQARPGNVIYYNAAGGPPPQQITPAELPSYVVGELQQLQTEILDISGVHGTSMGRVARGVNSAATVRALSTNDASQLQTTQSNIERSVACVAKTVLLLMKKHFTEKQFMRMLDSTGEVIFKELNNTNIVDLPEIHLEAGSLFKSETADRQAMILDMLQLGLIEKDDALKELQFKTSNKFVMDKITSMSHAKEMLNAVASGFDVQVYPTDDIAAFERVFSEFVRTEEFYKLPVDRQDAIAQALDRIVQMKQIQRQGGTGTQGEIAQNDLKRLQTIAGLRQTGDGANNVAPAPPLGGAQEQGLSVEEQQASQVDQLLQQAQGGFPKS